MKKIGKIIFTFMLSVLTLINPMFQVQADELTSQLEVVVQGNGQVIVNEVTVTNENSFVQAFEVGQEITIQAIANENSHLSNVTLNGEMYEELNQETQWSTTYAIGEEDAKLVLTFEEDEKKETEEINTEEDKEEESTQITGGTSEAGSSVSRKVARAASNGIVINNANDVTWINPEMPDYGLMASLYTLSNGQKAFCGQGMNAGPRIGQTVSDPVEVDNANLRKALFYGYNGPGDILTSKYGSTAALALTSELVSYANSGTCSSATTPDHFNWIMNNVGNLIFSQADPSGYTVYRCSNSEYGTNWQGNYTKRQDVCFGVYSPYGSVKISKESLISTISSNNSNYATMEGAEYGLYSDSQATKLVGTLKIGKDGQSNTIEDLEIGTYYIKETKAPKGYALDTQIYSIMVKANETATQVLKDVPQSNPIDLLLLKVDKDTKNQAQGEATLEDAEFTIKFYDYVSKDNTDPATLNKKPLRTWVMKTKSDGSLPFVSSQKVSGDDFYINSSGQIVLPLGTVTIQETKAPKGYEINDTIYVQSITSKGNAETITTYNAPTIQNKVKKGRFSLVKFFTEGSQSEVVEAEKEAQFVAVLETYYNQANSDMNQALELAQKNGTDKEWSILTTDKNGEATSNELAYGKYVVAQIASGTNAKDTYELDEPFYFIVDDTCYGMTQDGRRIEVSSDGLVHFYINNVPFTSSLKIVKKDVNSGKTISLNGAAFKIKKFKEDGSVYANYEKKNLRTDKDGYLSMKVGGQWYDTFVTNSKNQLSVSDALVANSKEQEGSITLPLSLTSGTYQLEEVQAPSGYILSEPISFEISKSKVSEQDEDNAPVLTILAEDIPVTGEIEFTKEFVDGESILHGSVSFDLIAKEDIVDASDGSILYKKDEKVGTYTLDENNKITIQNLPMGIGTSSFRLIETSTYENYQLDEKGCSIILKQKDQEQEVVKETCSMKNKPIKISTKALNKQTDESKFNASSSITVYDEVSYEGLITGKTYTLHAQLMDKETNEVISEGNKEFIAKDSKGSVQVPIKLDASELGNKKFVVFEELLNTSKKDHEECIIASHKDIEDENQTIEILDSTIHTTLTSNGNHEQQVTEDSIELVDKVSYENLVVGQTYKVKGKLMNKETQEVFKDNDGNPVEAETTFTAEKPKGSVDVTFTLDGKQIASNTSLVAYEALYEMDDEEILVTKHKDIEDEGQTISMIDIRTKAQTDNGTQMVQENEKVTITDTVMYEGLTIGKEYTVKGTLMDASSGKPFEVDGKKITSSQTFICEQKNGSIELTFEVDTSVLKSGNDIVVFESLYRDDQEIAVHHDLTDEDQTIHVVDIHTMATSQKDNHKALASEKTTIVDTVQYENLQVGKTYTVKGILMNPETKETLMVDGKEVTSEKTFEATKKNGSIDLTFELDATNLENTSTVVFEDLYLEDQKIAVHHDFKDENQTIEFVLPTLKINKVDSLTNTNITHSDFTFTMYANEECTKKAQTLSTISEEGRAIVHVEQGTWYIKETKAPSGYQLSNEKIKVEFKENNLYVNGEKVDMDEDYVYNINVKNTSNRSINTGFYNNTFGKWVTLCIASIIMFELIKRR